MIRSIWVVLRREWRENIRERWLLATLALQLGAILAFALFLLDRVQALSEVPNAAEKLAYFSDLLGMPMTLESLVAQIVQALDYLILTQLLGMTAVIAGHASLHDKQSGTLPFLLLAPLHRRELLAGKVLGSVAVPLAFYLAVGGATLVLAASFPVTAASAAMLPPSPGFLVAFLLGTPAWATFLGALCVAISAVATDVRTAQQASWMLVFFATFLVGPLLVGAMALGPVVQGVIAGVGAGLALAAIRFAARLASRELGR